MPPRKRAKYREFDERCGQTLTGGSRRATGLWRVGPNRYRCVVSGRPAGCDEQVLPRAKALEIWDRGRPRKGARPHGGWDDVLCEEPMLRMLIAQVAFGAIPVSAMKKAIESSLDRRSAWSRCNAGMSLGQLVTTATGCAELGEVVETARVAHETRGVPMPEWYVVPRSGMGALLDGPIGRCLVATRAGTVRMRRGEVWLRVMCPTVMEDGVTRTETEGPLLTDAVCEAWTFMRARTEAAKMAACFAECDTCDATAIARRLWGATATPGPTEQFLAKLARSGASGATSVLGVGATLVFAPCLKRSALDPSPNPKAGNTGFTNVVRGAYAMALAELVQMARLDVSMTAATVRRVLEENHVTRSRVGEMLTWMKRKATSMTKVNPIRCTSRQADLICPYARDDRMRCTGNDPSATPASVTVGLTLRGASTTATTVAPTSGSTN